jgi:hypothetical protein
LLQLELEKLIIVRDGDRERHITKREALIMALVNDAITNKPRARADLLRLLDVSPPAEEFVAYDDDEAALEGILAWKGDPGPLEIGGMGSEAVGGEASEGDWPNDEPTSDNSLTDEE